MDDDEGRRIEITLQRSTKAMVSLSICKFFNFNL